jgi:protein-S-isoprenylcysteine O-methyltransferase Ste14
MSFVLIQTALIAVWLLAVLWNPEPRLLPSGRLLDVLGVLFCGLGLLIAAAAFHALGESFRISPAPHQRATLVTHGVYRLLRHPMYTSVASLSLGAFLMRPSWVIGLLGAALVGFYHFKAYHEERLLVQHYPEYGDYRRRTFGIIPWVRR